MVLQQSFFIVLHENLRKNAEKSCYLSKSQLYFLMLLASYLIRIVKDHLINSNNKLYGVFSLFSSF